MSTASRGGMALVTGGAGFIGSHLVDRLVAGGYRVRVLDDFSSGNEQNLTPRREAVEVLRGDLCDPPTVERAVAGCELVFHEAAVPSVPRSVAEPLRTNRVNIDGTLLLLETARQAGVRRLVFAASSAAYGDTPALPKIETMPPLPLSPYGLQKYVGEAYCQLYTQLYGLETVALRYFNIYGPRQSPKSEYAAVIPRFITACLAGERPHIYGDGEQTRDFTYVGDAVQANWLAAFAPKAPGLVINVAGGQRVSLNQLFAVVKKTTGAAVEPIYEPGRPGDVRDSQADLGRAREALGYAPGVGLDDGIARTTESFRAQGRTS